MAGKPQGMKFKCRLSGGGSLTFEADEFHPYEPAAYVHDPGWSGHKTGTEEEYFLSTGGELWRQPDNVMVGYSVKLYRDVREMEQMLAEDEKFGEPDL